MAQFSTISEAEIDPDSAATAALFAKLRDNLHAVIEGDLTAPNIKQEAFGVHYYQTPGSNTWVCPAGVTLVRVTAMGGGGGGGGAGSSSGSCTDGSNGGPSSFDNAIIGYGGAGGVKHYTGVGNTTTTSHASAVGGGVNIVGGGASGGPGAIFNGLSAHPGGAGGLSIGDYVVVPGNSYPVVVGVAGARGTGNTFGANGGNGMVIVQY